MELMAQGAIAARDGVVPSIPQDEILSSRKLVGIGCQEPWSNAVMPSISEEELQRAFRLPHEDPLWTRELSNSLQFKPVLAYRFKRGSHITVLELRNYKTFLKVAARKHEDQRVPALLDSRVSIGAAAKGRSSSPALTRVLQGSLGYIIGGGLQIGPLHTYSGDNRGAEPSRQKAVRGPSRDEPEWLQQLDAGDHEFFGFIVYADQFHRPVARWLRFLAALHQRAAKQAAESWTYLPYSAPVAVNWPSGPSAHAAIKDEKDLKRILPGYRSVRVGEASHLVLDVPGSFPGGSLMSQLASRQTFVPSWTTV